MKNRDRDGYGSIDWSVVPPSVHRSVRQPRSITSTTTYWDQCIFRITTCPSPPYSIIFLCSNNQATNSWGTEAWHLYSTIDLTRDLCNTFSAASVACTSDSDCPTNFLFMQKQYFARLLCYEKLSPPSRMAKWSPVRVLGWLDHQWCQWWPAAAARRNI